MDGSPQTPDQSMPPAVPSSQDETTQPYTSAFVPPQQSAELPTQPVGYASAPAPGSSPAPAPTDAIHLLEEEVARLSRQGYVIVDRGPTSVQLKRHKHFSIWWALFWLIVVPGGGLFIYLAWYVLVKHDRVSFLRITPDGRVMRSTS